MASAKDIIVKPIKAADATRIVKSVHYSGSVAANSQLHFGVFLEGRLLGGMQFGPSMDKKKSITLVRDTGWNGFLELNRMAFHDLLPRNSESRALGIALRMIRKHYPHIEWVLSFSDAAQCGDGTIYRASGFVLTAIKKNKAIIRFPDGETFSQLSISNNGGSSKNGCALRRRLCEKWGVPYFTASTVKPFLDIGASWLPGFQLRYVYFLNPAARERLSVPVIPFSRIAEMGASMYRGQSVRPKQATTATSGEAVGQHQPGRSNQ
jgi:hypothetical protein